MLAAPLASLYFAELALEMIWTHELSHCVLGHIDFARANLGVRAMSERPLGDGDFLLMPMEVEADRLAVITAVQTAILGNKSLILRQNFLTSRVTFALPGCWLRQLC